MAIPTTYSWLLEDSALPPAPSSIPGVALGETDECDARYFTQAELLEILDRVFPASYLDPIKNVGPGYEAYQAFAKLFERVSLAAGHLECGLSVTLAHGPVRATGLVEFYRANAGAGAVTVLKGSVVRTSKTGRNFIVLDDAVFGPADLGPIAVRIQAEASGFEYNVPGEVITAAGEVLPGEIDTIYRPLQNPPFGDPTILVRQVAETAGGVAGALDQLGRDRRIIRVPGEPDQAYKARIRSLPDTVSPEALRRAVAAKLAPYGVVAAFIETWQMSYQTCWDGPPAPLTVVDPILGPYDPDFFCYDDPRPAVPFRNRWLDEEDYRGAFIFVLPNLATIEDCGMAFDDTAIELADHESSLGLRAHSAFDTPTDFPFGLAGGYDGFDPPKQAVYKGVYDLLHEIKAGGVVVAIELEGQ